MPKVIVWPALETTSFWLTETGLKFSFPDWEAVRVVVPVPLSVSVDSEIEATVLLELAKVTGRAEELVAESERDPFPIHAFVVSLQVIVCEAFPMITVWVTGGAQQKFEFPVWIAVTVVVPTPRVTRLVFESVRMFVSPIIKETGS